MLAHSLYVLCLLVCVNGLEEEEGGFDFIAICIILALIIIIIVIFKINGICF